MDLLKDLSMDLSKSFSPPMLSAGAPKRVGEIGLLDSDRRGLLLPRVVLPLVLPPRVVLTIKMPLLEGETGGEVEV
jgi:hypothetical protein